MGKSKATRRIERIMNKLRMEGKLDEPYYPNGRPKVKRDKPKEEQKVQPTRSVVPALAYSADCCVRSLSRLPDGVVSCPDCPLTSPG